MDLQILDVGSAGLSGLLILLGVALCFAGRRLHSLILFTGGAMAGAFTTYSLLELGASDTQALSNSSLINIGLGALIGGVIAVVLTDAAIGGLILVAGLFIGLMAASLAAGPVMELLAGVLQPDLLASLEWLILGGLFIGTLVVVLWLAGLVKNFIFVLFYALAGGVCLYAGLSRFDRYWQLREYLGQGQTAQQIEGTAQRIVEPLLAVLPEAARWDIFGYTLPQAIVDELSSADPLLVLICLGTAAAGIALNLRARRES